MTPPSRRASSSAALLLALVLLALPRPALAAPAWLLPDTPLSPLAQTPTTDPPQIAADAAGDFVAVWTVNDGTSDVVEASVHLAGTGNSFSAVQTLSSDGTNASDPRVAMDAQGDAIVIWTASDSTVDYAFMPAGATAFGAAHAIAAADTKSTPAVAIDGAGDAVVLWQHTLSTHVLIDYARRPAGGEFGAVTSISNVSDNSSAPQVAMDPAGAAAAVWLTNVNGAEVAEGASQPAGGGSFGAAVALSKLGTNAYTPQVAMDGKGDATAVWSFGSSPYSVQESDQPAGGAFKTSPATIASGGTSPQSPVVADNAAGETAIAWQQTTGEIVIRPAGGSFGAEQALKPEGGQLSIALDAAGDTTVVGVDANANAQAQVAPAGGTFGASQQLSNAGEGGATPDVAVDPAGDAAAVWSGMQPSPRIRAAGYVGSPPVISGLSVPPSAYTGAAVAMSAMDLSVWSQIGSTTWSFGDGSTGADGRSVSHVFADPGLFVVHVSAVDVLGNLSTAQARIDVLPSPTPAPLPAPKLAHTANVLPVSGTVLVRVPGSKRFVPLPAGLQIPVGSVIDATHGTVEVIVAGPHGKTMTAQFHGGEFVLEQARSDLTTAVLAGGSFAGCPVPARHAAFAARRRKSRSTTVRSLWANAHGSFQTRGRYASGAVSGTEWLTQDRCDGTYVKVTRDVVLVIDFPHHHRHVRVRQGHSYLALAPGF